MIKILTQNGIENTNLDGARDGYFNSGGKDGISSGILNNGTLTAQGNVLTLDTCEMRIKGHRIVIDEPITKTISGFPTVNTNYQFIAKITYNDGSVTFDTEARPTTSLIQDDILNGNGTYEVVIGEFIHKTDGTIANLVPMMRVIFGGGGGQDGTTFTPYVDENGVISWTNDGGRENPEPVNIKGDTGAKGDTGVGVPTGGTTGQVLKKKSGTDYDTEWGDGGASGTGYILKPTALNDNNLPNVPIDKFQEAIEAYKAGIDVFLDLRGIPSFAHNTKIATAYRYFNSASGESLSFQLTYEYGYTLLARNGAVSVFEGDYAIPTNMESPAFSGKFWGYEDSVSEVHVGWEYPVISGTEDNPFIAAKSNDLVTKKHFENMSKGGTPINKGNTLSKLYFDTEKTPDLSIFTYTLDEDMGFYTAGLIGFKNASNEYIGYLSAVKVSDTVYALIYENRVTGDISYLYVSDNIEYGGISFSKGWQSFNNPFPVTSGTVADLDQTATKPWNGVWVSEKAFYARTDEIPAEPNNGTLTIQKNGTTVGTFGANQSENTTVNITVPTKVSQLQNDAGFTKNKGTVISVRVNGTTYTADANGLVDLGTISGGTVYRTIYNEIY